MAETYRLFHGLNDFLESSGFRPLEELLLGNSLSGMISEFLVKNIARAAETLETNAKVGGHPDLLPKGHYASNLALKGDEGIEIKSSIQRGGWQGHNLEDCWLMVFRYAIGEQKEEASTPLTFLEILCAKLDEADWSFSGRTGASRRTPTSVHNSGWCREAAEQFPLPVARRRHWSPSSYPSRAVSAFSRTDSAAARLSVSACFLR